MSYNVRSFAKQIHKVILIMLLIYIIYVLIAPKFQTIIDNKDIFVNYGLNGITNKYATVSVDRGACESISIFLDATEHYQTSVGNVKYNIVEPYPLHVKRFNVVGYMLGKLDNYYPSGFT